MATMEISFFCKLNYNLLIKYTEPRNDSNTCFMRCLLIDIPVLVWTEMICALVRGINSTVINSTEFGCCFFETRYTAGSFSFPIISKVKHLQTPDSRFLMIYSHSCFIPSELWAFSHFRIEYSKACLFLHLSEPSARRFSQPAETAELRHQMKPAIYFPGGGPVRRLRCPRYSSLSRGTEESSACQ